MGLKHLDLGATDISLAGEGIGSLLVAMALEVCHVVQSIMNNLVVMATQIMTKSVQENLDPMAILVQTGNLKNI